MTLTFLGNRYEVENSTITAGTIAYTTAKYRGIEYQACTTTIPSSTGYARKYRGVAY